MKKLTSILTLLTLCVCTAFAQEKIRVACVGNSVTYGMGIPDRAEKAYPKQLQGMLGDAYEVENFGHSGSTLLRKGHRPYMQVPEYRKAIDFKADLVVIHLGLNDTDPRNWPCHRDEFHADYYALIDSFKVANPAAKIWICRMTPISHNHRRFQSGTRDWHAQIQESIEQVAKAKGVGLIDFFAPLHARYELFPDALHPNAEGATILAEEVYKHITGDFGGVKLPTYYSDNMVIQRDEPIRIAGTADVSERVDVSLNGKKGKAYASAQGTWEVTLPAMPAGGPYKLTVKTKKRTIELNDVWMGDVWICSGQSNMEWRLKNCTTGKEDCEAAENQPLLHLYNMRAIADTYDREWSVEICEKVNRLQYFQPTTWERCSATAAGDFSAIAYHFGKTLADSLNVHVGLILNAVGGSTTESWIDRWTLEFDFPQVLYNWTEGDFGQDWARGRAKRNIAASKVPLQRHPFMPHYLFDAGMLPLKGLNPKGVIWYQGESNAHNVELHEALFTLLEKSWRNYFNEPELPFYFVQLSSIAPRQTWPHFRDSQRQLAENLPYTWMAVSSDLGHETDVHPRNKRPVGQRLAFQALRHSFGRSLVAEGPKFLSMQVKGSAIFVNFAEAEGLQTADGKELRGFEVAGEDGIFYPATTEILGTQIKVTAKDVQSPVSVRYAWKPFTDANLVNAARIPASTFKAEIAKP